MYHSYTFPNTIKWRRRCVQLVFLLLFMGYCHAFYQESLYLQMDIDRWKSKPLPPACQPLEDLDWTSRAWLSVGIGADYREEECDEYERRVKRLPIPNPLMIAWDLVLTTLLHPLVPIAEFVGLALGKLVRHHNIVVQIAMVVGIPVAVMVLMWMKWKWNMDERDVTTYRDYRLTDRPNQMWITDGVGSESGRGRVERLTIKTD